MGQVDSLLYDYAAGVIAGMLGLHLSREDFSQSVVADCSRGVRHLCGISVRASARPPAALPAAPARPERRRELRLTHRLRHLGTRGVSRHRPPLGRLYVLCPGRLRGAELETTKLYVTLTLASTPPSFFLHTLSARSALVCSFGSPAPVKQ